MSKFTKNIDSFAETFQVCTTIDFNFTWEKPLAWLLYNYFDYYPDFFGKKTLQI